VSSIRTLIVLALLATGAAPALAQKSGSLLLPGGDSKAPVVIDAKKLEYFDKEQKLVYSGNVVAKQGDAVLRSATLVIFLASSVMQGNASPQSNTESQIKRMEATGTVTIVSKDQVGVGDRGVYERGDNKVFLIGNVSLSQGGNLIKGKPDSRLIYDLTTSQAVIEGGVNSIMTPGSGDDQAQKGKAEPKPAAASTPRQPKAP
jgi:lipopolysaccharide export system protein LptA